ncbi:MAG: purine-nucleoside phosphorylase [Crocinitomicaceae bacterium]|nr:purine-nucleoside phosphorylase [Crocinitomicaceae bacterium]|tara:strand:+ start:2165 stop:2986 length:822 start_codon:yes stop_codon:yes gene_type:complete
MEVLEELQESSKYLRERGVDEVDVAIVLGTGLGGLVDAIDIEKSWSYSQIPHLPVATVEQHFGRLIYGLIGGKKVLAWQGRFHFYEGYSMEQVVKPVRISGMLGANTLLISNASGSLNPDFKKGGLMLIEDHINLLPDTPLRGENLASLGVRFPDMSRPYDLTLSALLKDIASDLGIKLPGGVYCSVAGPQLETRAEYRYLRTIGADAVGMSTVPEVIAAVHMGMPCAAVSVLTDECNPEELKPFDLSEVVAMAQKAEPLLTKLIVRLLGRME